MDDMIYMMHEDRHFSPIESEVVVKWFASEEEAQTSLDSQWGGMNVRVMSEDEYVILKPMRE